MAGHEPGDCAERLGLRGPVPGGPRLPVVDLEDVDPILRAILEDVAGPRGRLSNVFRVLAASPEGLRRIAALGEFVRFQAGTPDLVRECVILAVAQATGCRYEWDIHFGLLERGGMADQALEALALAEAGHTGTPLLDAIALARSVAIGEPSRLEVARRLEAELGSDGYLNVAITAAYYGLLARLIIELNVPLEPTAPTEEGK